MPDSAILPRAASTASSHHSTTPAPSPGKAGAGAGGAAKRSGANKTKGAVRAKSGCYTCRIRRKVRCSSSLAFFFFMIIITSVVLIFSALFVSTEMRRAAGRGGQLPDLRPSAPAMPRLWCQTSRLDAGESLPPSPSFSPSPPFPSTPSLSLFRPPLSRIGHRTDNASLPLYQDGNSVPEMRERIKQFLAAQGMIKGHSGTPAASTSPTLSPSTARAAGASLPTPTHAISTHNILTSGGGGGSPTGAHHHRALSSGGRSATSANAGGGVRKHGGRHDSSHSPPDIDADGSGGSGGSASGSGSEDGSPPRRPLGVSGGHGLPPLSAHHHQHPHPLGVNTNANNNIGSLSNNNNGHGHASNGSGALGLANVAIAAGGSPSSTSSAANGGAGANVLRLTDNARSPSNSVSKGSGVGGPLSPPTRLLSTSPSGHVHGSYNVGNNGMGNESNARRDQGQYTRECCPFV